MKKFLHFIFFYLLLLFFNPGIHSLQAQVKFSVICPEKKIGKNDFLQVQFMVQNASNVESIIPPRFKNFDIVSGPNQQSGMSIVNGKTDQYVAISFYLKPIKTGKFSIGRAEAIVDGKKYYTETLGVEVINSSQPSSSSPSTGNNLSPFNNFNYDLASEPFTHVFDDYILKNGENVNDKVQKNIFVKLDLNKTNCYVGEPVVASYKLYTRLRSESLITKAPSFNGFSVSDLELSLNGTSKVEKYKGRDYNVYTLRKVQLYPLQTGQLMLDPVVAENKITFLKQEYAGRQKGDLFFDMLKEFADEATPMGSVIQENVTLKSEPVTVTVKPLPESEKPAGFKGAVGSFKLNAGVDKKNITTDDAGNLKITISGAGNIQMINAPKIAWPKGIDGYEPKVTEDIDKYSVPMQGTKEFVYPFTVSKKGKYTLPSVSFSYFEPVTGRYNTATSPALMLDVSPGKRTVKETYVKAASGEDENDNDKWKTRSAIFSGVALAAAFLLFYVTKKRAKQAAEKKVLAKNTAPPCAPEPEYITGFSIPENPLGTAYEKLLENNNRGFYCTLDASLKRYLAAKLKVPTEELTRKRLNEELDSSGISLGTSLMLNSLIDDLELHVYAPASDHDQLQAVYEKASEVVSLLDKQVS